MNTLECRFISSEVCSDVYRHVRPTVGMLGPRNLRVSDEWYTRFRVSWDPAPSRVNGYKLVYQPEGMDMLLLKTYLR